MRLGRAALATSWLLYGLLSNFFALELRAQPDALAVPSSQSIQRPELPAVDVERFGEVELRVPRPTIDGARAGRIAMRHFRRRQVAVGRIVERRSARWTSAGASRLARSLVGLKRCLVVNRPAAGVDLDCVPDFTDGGLGRRETRENFRKRRVHIDVSRFGQTLCDGSLVLKANLNFNLTYLHEVRLACSRYAACGALAVP